LLSAEDYKYERCMVWDSRVGPLVMISRVAFEGQIVLKRWDKRYIVYPVNPGLFKPPHLEHQ
jgi:hypothetical protein